MCPWTCNVKSLLKDGKGAFWRCTGTFGRETEYQEAVLADSVREGAITCPTLSTRCIPGTSA